jgi:hypothetical protein
MGIASTSPTTRRGYLSQDELEQYANITVTNSDEADDRIGQAEEMIDAYVGFQEKFIDEKIEGRMAAIASNSFTLQTSQQNSYDVDYFKWCEIEIIGGTGVGQRRKITASTKEGVLTVDSAWSTTPDTTSFYRIYQLGKFPRCIDVTSYSEQTPTTYYKQVPEAIKRAVAAQVEYVIEMGDEYFSTDKAEKQSESIGDYSYTNAKVSLSDKLICPKAKLLLRGIKNRTGVLLSD